jgi:drug/metabolite transporter (DMT)-like permease
VTVNLLWSFSSVTVALLGIVWLSERPTLFQWSGILLAIIGAFVYFYPAAIPQSQIIGVIAAAIGILANAVSAIIGRDVNRSGRYHPLVVTVVSMGTGSLALLATGLLVEGIPVIGLKSWAIILWLAVVNTAFAFTLWNHTLRTLTAIESSIINGTMLVWIPIFAVLFLGEKITGKEIIGLVGVGLGTLIVQMRHMPKAKNNST